MRWTDGLLSGADPVSPFPRLQSPECLGIIQAISHLWYLTIWHILFELSSISCASAVLQQHSFFSPVCNFLFQCLHFAAVLNFSVSMANFLPVIWFRLLRATKSVTPSFPAPSETLRLAADRCHFPRTKRLFPRKNWAPELSSVSFLLILILQNITKFCSRTVTIFQFVVSCETIERVSFLLCETILNAPITDATRFIG